MTDRRAPGVRIVTAAPGSGDFAPLDLAGRIISFRYEDHGERADQCTLELDNFDLSIFDRDELGAGAVLSVSWGYPGQMARARQVVVRRMKGFSTLTLECHGGSVLLDRVARTRRFEARTSSQIVREVASELGYDEAFIEVEDTTEEHDVVVQAGETDARFLGRLAAREGFVFRADADRLWWCRPVRQDTPSHVLSYYAGPGRGDILDVSVETDLARRVGREVVRGRDPRTRTTLEAVATNETTERPALSEVVETIDPETGRSALDTRRATSSVRTTTAPTPEAVQREADARFTRAEERSVHLRVRVVGDPTLAAGRLVEVRNISRRLSGLYHVRCVRHVIGGEGYTAELELTRNGVGRRGRSDERQHGGTPAPLATAPEEPSSRGAGPPELRPVERIDPETGRAVLEYRSESAR